jgi:hypothetical protein
MNWILLNTHYIGGSEADRIAGQLSGFFVEIMDLDI